MSIDEPVTEKNSASSRAVIEEVVKTVVYGFLFALIFRTFAYEPFNIPSESMLPNLLIGDYLFVAKYSYGYSHYSLPLSLPLFNGRIFARQVTRGDIVVFKLPRDNKTVYIKRIVGIPGDRIQMIDGVLFINGQEVRKERIKDFLVPDRFGNLRRFRQYRETMPNGRSYTTLDTEESAADNTRIFVVPAGHYFAMGDNRDNSSDSRVANSGVGYIPAENLVGRAEVLFFSTDGSARIWEFWRWIQATRFSRLFTVLH